jgi:hypothetical protein
MIGCVNNSLFHGFIAIVFIVYYIHPRQTILKYPIRQLDLKHPQ